METVDKTVSNFTGILIPYASVLLCGRRRGGKTVAATELAYLNREMYDEAYLLSGTATEQFGAFKFIHPQAKYHGFQEDVLQHIMDTQINRIEIAKQEMMCEKNELGRKFKNVEEEISKRVPQVLVILDDVVSNSLVQRSKILNEFFTLGRHRRLSVWVLSQNVCASGSLSIQARGNCDFVFCTELDAEKAKKTLTEFYFSSNGHKIGQQLVDSITSVPHTMAVAELHMKDRSDYIKSFRAKDPHKNPPPDFIIPCKEAIKARRFPRAMLVQDWSNADVDPLLNIPKKLMKKRIPKEKGEKSAFLDFGSPRVKRNTTLTTHRVQTEEGVLETSEFGQYITEHKVKKRKTFKI